MNPPKHRENKSNCFELLVYWKYFEFYFRIEYSWDLTQSFRVTTFWSSLLWVSGVEFGALGKRSCLHGLWYLSVLVKCYLLYLNVSHDSTFVLDVFTQDVMMSWNMLAHPIRPIFCKIWNIWLTKNWTIFCVPSINAHENLKCSTWCLSL